jgi:hypothetical protein
LRIDFDAVRPVPASVIAADLRVSLPELIDFFSMAWHNTTLVLPLAATHDPVEVAPAGAPRVELHIQNERPDASGDPRVLRTLDMVDRRLQHTNRYAIVVTCGFPLPMVRERRSAVPGVGGRSR